MVIVYKKYAILKGEIQLVNNIYCSSGMAFKRLS